MNEMSSVPGSAPAFLEPQPASAAQNSASRAASAAQPELSLGRLVAFAMPALPVAAFQLPFVIIVPQFYAENVGLSLATVGLVMFAVRLMDAILDPLIGYSADHIKPRWGRRRTWFGLAAIPTTIGALLVFNPFPPVDTTATWFWITWLFLASAMLSVGYTALSLSHQSWAAELSPSYYGRNRMFAAREVMIVFGTLVATGLPFGLTLLGYHGAGPVLIGLSLLIGVALPVFAFLTVWLVPEPKDITQHPLNFITGLKGMAQNKPFVRLVLSFAIANMANGVPAVLLVYFVRDYVHGNEDARNLFLFLYFLFGVLATPVWLWVARKTSKHRAWCIAMIVACSAFIWAPFIGYDQLGAWSPWAFGFMMFFTGMAVGADLMLPPSIQADVIDVDTAKSGEQHTGFYFAIWALATKVALAIAMVSFVVLDVSGFKKTTHVEMGAIEQLQQMQPLATPETPQTVTKVPVDAPRVVGRRIHGSNPDSRPVEQTPLAHWTLAILYSWVPVLLKLIAVGFMWNFPIGAKEQARLRAEIEAHAREKNGRPA